MRNRFLVCYDVSDPKRLARTYREMNGFGDPAQYSVFICDLSPKGKSAVGGGPHGSSQSEGGPGLDCRPGSLGGPGWQEPYHPGKSAGFAPPGGGDSMMGRRHTVPCERWVGEAAKLHRSQLPS